MGKNKEPHFLHAHSSEIVAPGKRIKKSSRGKLWANIFKTLVKDQAKKEKRKRGKAKKTKVPVAMMTATVVPNPVTLPSVPAIGAEPIQVSAMETTAAIEPKQRRTRKPKTEPGQPKRKRQSTEKTQAQEKLFAQRTRFVSDMRAQSKAAGSAFDLKAAWASAKVKYPTPTKAT